MAKPKRQNTQKSPRTAGFPKDAPQLLVYEALAAFNRSFENILLDLERLGALSLFPRRWQRKFLKASRATLEATRAWTNFEWTDVLRQQEERAWARFARIRQREDAQ